MKGLRTQTRGWERTCPEASAPSRSWGFMFVCDGSRRLWAGTGWDMYQGKQSGSLRNSMERTGGEGGRPLLAWHLQAQFEEVDSAENRKF